MTNFTLITGGPGSGKTDAVLARLAARYEADPFAETVVLIPTVRHGDQFRRRLVDRCGVALRLRVETIAQFSRWLASDVWVPSRGMVDELLSRTIRREIENGLASYFRPIAGTKGLGNLLRGAVGDLLAEGTAPQAMSEAAARSGSPSLMALSAIFRAYSSEIEQRDWVHPVQTGMAAKEAVEAGAGLPGVIVLDGFHLFRGTELALVEALAQRADVAITFDPQAGARSGYDYARLLDRFPGADVVELEQDDARDPPTVIAGEAADREGQLRAIARQIKQRLNDEPSLRPSDFAVAFRQASPYLSLTQQVFAEYDLPLDPAAGERLSARPLGVWLRRLLHLAREGWPVRDVVAVLSSGFVDLDRWGLLQGDVGRFARHGRENNLWSGREALGRIVEGLRVEAEAESTSDAHREVLRRVSDGVTTAIEGLGAMLGQPEGTAAEHAQRLEDALFGANALVRPASREKPGVDMEMEALRGYLQELVATHEALGGEAEGFDSFVARLEGKLEATAVLLREPGGVLVAPMHTLHGLRFDFVAVGGLIAGEFPAPRATAGLLDANAIDALNEAGLGLPPEPRLTEHELWESVSTRAERAMGLWKTRVDERGRPAAASYYFPSTTSSDLSEARMPDPEGAASRRELAIACSQQWASQGRLRPRGEAAWPVVRLAAAVERRRRSFDHAGVYEGRLAPGLAPRLTDGDSRWSASRIESYRTCSFQFFGQYGLHLRELDQELEGPDAAIRGSVIHDIMQDALAPLIEKGQPLVPDTLPDVIARLREKGREIWNEAPAKQGFGRAALWRLDADDTLQRVEMLLHREAAESEHLGVTRIVGAEREIVASLPLHPPMKVTARIDRLDAGDGLVVIVDYKSGREIKKDAVLKGKRVQLQLYGYLGMAEAAADRVVARYAWLNPNIKPWNLDSSDEEDHAALSDIVEVARDVRSSVASGDFRVNPQERPCPSYCAMRHVCRVNEFSRWKHWD